MNHEKRISRATTIIVLLALIRTIAEPFRLQHAAGTNLTFDIIQPYLLAALITAFGLFAITILQYFERYRWIIAIGVLVIAAMVMIKVKYL